MLGIDWVEVIVQISYVICDLLMVTKKSWFVGKYKKTSMGKYLANRKAVYLHKI